MHNHDNGYDHEWEWGPPQQCSQTAAQHLTLLLTRRMAAQLQAVSHDLELPTDEAALLLLRESVWRHYHMMQHI